MLLPPLPPGLDAATLNRLTAGLTPPQLVWLSGYCYALATAPEAATPGSGAASPAAPVEKLTVLYGSHTGNGQRIAEQAAIAATAHGFRPEVRDMRDYPGHQLPQEQNLLLIVSTHGEGEPPASAAALHEFMGGPHAPQLPNLKFSVLALGDTSYRYFCQTGRDFDERLAALGGTRLLGRINADVAYKAAAAHWIAATLAAIPALSLPTPAATLAAPASRAATVVADPKLSTELPGETPWPASVLKNIRLSGRGAAQETHHLELDLTSSGLTYAPGDALAVRPLNHPALVADVLRATHLAADAPVLLGGASLPLAAALASHRELTVLTGEVLARYAALAPHAELQGLLVDPARLQTYLYGRDVADLLLDFPAGQLTPQALADTLRPLPPRAYSIASSLLAYPSQAHLTVAALRYEAHGRHKQGVCSSLLAGRVAVGDEVGVFVQHNAYFKLPEDTGTDIIMVSAGTGIAPFRAFVQERVALGASGRNWLLFGNPHAASDFLYQAEWQQYLRRGGLARLDVAFSRDQATKVYVQDRLLENSRTVFDWLENGAQLYVCGNKNHLGPAVQAALVQIVAREASLAPSEAAAYVKNLRQQRRYLEDVY